MVAEPTMLKITRRTDAAAITPTIVLEGQIAGRWVDELRAVLEQAWSTTPGVAVTLDLKDVTFIDISGLALVEDAGPAITVINCSLFAAEQLREVIARQQTVRS
jgi:hypothetical protein